MHDPLIEFHNVAKSYRGPKSNRVVLRDFTGSFPRGRNIGLLGVNGAGKSTLLRLIAGTEFPDRGRIRRHARVSYPLGLAGFKGNLTARENCRFVARIYGLDPRRVERFVEEFAEIGKYFDMPIQSFSSGMKQRVTFGVTLAADFECYLVDESLSVGDAMFRARCDAIFGAKRKTASMILVSHSMVQIKKYCDTAAILSKGELRLYDKLDDALKDYAGLVGHLDLSE
jgi:capsular polysaccharide transport system ATP-binding protein